MKMTMKSIIILIGILIANNSFGQTQLDMNMQSQEKYSQADEELNSVYKKILVDYKNDAEFIKNLKLSQKIWIQFRDAEMKVKYPDREIGYYGSMHPSCWSLYMTELTTERTKCLKIWLTGIEEGDACGGSIKLK